MKFFVKVLALGVFNGVFRLNVNADYDDAQEQTTLGDGVDFRRQETSVTDATTTEADFTPEEVVTPDDEDPSLHAVNENAVKWDCIVGWHWQCDAYCEKYRADCEDCEAKCKPESSFFGHCDCIRTPSSVVKHKNDGADGLWPKGISF